MCRCISDSDTGDRIRSGYHVYCRQGEAERKPVHFLFLARMRRQTVLTDSLFIPIYKVTVDQPAATTVGFKVKMTDSGELVMTVATGGTVHRHRDVTDVETARVRTAL